MSVFVYQNGLLFPLLVIVASSFTPAANTFNYATFSVFTASISEYVVVFYLQEIAGEIL
jgi:hypothetical protein